MEVLLPKGKRESLGPCWIPIKDTEGKWLKPLIKCQCGKVTGIGLHHVHADGRVMLSYFHSKEGTFMHNGKTYTHEAGCGWHVYLRLLDYDLGEFPPDADA